MNAPMNAALTSLVDTRLPLSWAHSAVARVDAVRLATGKTFIASADLPSSSSFADLLDDAARSSPRGVVVKGCGRAMASTLAPEQRILLGHSACVPLSGYRPPGKVRNLARRGAQALDVGEVDVLDDANAVAFSNLEHARLKPNAHRILHVYRTSFASAHRAFAASLKTGADGWAGVVTVTRYGESSFHVEQLARHPTAPPGTMELLLVHVLEQLQREGARELNLGEVPLMYPEKEGNIIGAELFGPRDRWVARAAPLLSRMARRRYNVGHLYQFKNKFAPEWEPRYFCGWPRLTIADLVALFAACRITKLIF